VSRALAVIESKRCRSRLEAGAPRIRNRIDPLCRDGNAPRIRNLIVLLWRDGHAPRIRISQQAGRLRSQDPLHLLVRNHIVLLWRDVKCSQDLPNETDYNRKSNGGL